MSGVRRTDDEVDAGGAPAGDAAVSLPVQDGLAGLPAHAGSARSMQLIERKVRAGFVLALVVISIVGVLLYYSISHLRDSADAAQRAELTIDALKAVLNELRDIETAVGRYVITGDAEHLEPQTVARQAIETQLRQLRDLTAHDPAQQVRLNALARLIAERTAIADQVIAARRSGGFAAGRAAIAGGEGRRVMDAIRGAMREIEDIEDSITREREAQAQRLAQLTKAGVVVGGALAFLFVAIALYIISRDFAGRRHADATVRRQAQLLDLARNSIFVCDLENRILYWNRGAQRIYGWAPEEAVGRKAHELLVTQFPLPRAEIDRLVQARGYWTGELTQSTRAGRTLIVDSHWSLQRDERGAPAAVLKINDDITHRKEAEAKLRAAHDELEARVRERTAELVAAHDSARLSERQFAAIVESAMDGIVTVDDAQRIVLFNTAAEKIFGYAAAEVVGQPLNRLLPARHREAHVAQVDAFGGSGLTRRAMAGAATVYGLRANGDEFSLEASISRIEVGGRRLYTSVLRDITERIEAERTHSRLAAIVESSDDAIIGKTLHGSITTWNPGAQRLFGYSAAEAVDRSITVIIPEDRLHEEDMIISRIAQGETVRHYETVRRHKDGRLIDISVTVSPIVDAGGAITGASKIARDITARKRAEQALRDSEKEIRTVTDAIPALIAYVDRERRYRFANLAYHEWFGMPRAKLIGKQMDEVLGAESYREIAGHLDAVLTGQPVSFERLQLQRGGGRDDKPRIFHVDYVPSRGADGAVNGAFIVAHDVTEVKRAEEMMLRTQKMEALGTLAGGIAHDFNNIIPAIFGFASLAESALPDEHPARASLAEIKKASKRAGDLVQRVLTFSRPQQQAGEAVNPEQVVREALKLARGSLPPSVELCTDLAWDVPAVRADATQLYQIVVNLVSNASDAIGARGGVVEVRLEAMDSGSEIVGLPAGKYARLTVSDDGCGMDRAMLRRIFDPFFTTKPAGKGTGLGLSIVSSIVTSLGGTVNAYSEPGKGTRFFVYLPVAVGGAGPAVAAPAAAQTGQGQRIMYIDDEEALIFLATHILKRLGYAVSGYTDAKAALQEFRARPQVYDAVITDVSMPGMSGYDVTRELVAIRPGVPVIVVSGYVRPEDEELAKSLGAREMLSKPNDVAELGAAIVRLLQELPRQ